MSAAEADERFAALVAEYRGAKRRPTARSPVPPPAGPHGRTRTRTESWTKTRTRSNARRELDETLATLVAVIVFCLGVGSGAAWPRHPLLALAIGVPSIVVGSWWLRHRRQGHGDD